MPEVLLALVPLLNENCESESYELRDAALGLGGNAKYGSFNAGCGRLETVKLEPVGFEEIEEVGFAAIEFAAGFDAIGLEDTFEGTGGNSYGAGCPCVFGVEAARSDFLGTMGNPLRFAGMLTARGLGVFVTNLASRPFLNTGSSRGRSLMLNCPP